MAAEVISTQELDFNTDASPATQDITIPADCTAVYMFWSYWRDATGYGLSTVTLETVAPDENFDEKLGADYLTATGVCVWYNPGTGSGQTVDISWDGAPSEGPTCLFVYVKGGNLTAARDIDSSAGQSTNDITVTIDSNATDLVLKYDERWHADTPPSLSGGWTNIATGGNNSEQFRCSSCNSPGAATTICNCEDEAYSSIVGISIPVASESASESPSESPSESASLSPSASESPSESPAAGGLKIDGNQAAGILADSDNFGYWNPSTFGPDSEVFATIATKPATDEYIELLARFDFSTGNGYGLRFTTLAGTDKVEIMEYASWTPTQIGADIELEFSAGDALGLEIIGTTLQAYRKPSGGIWALLGDSETD